MHAPNWCLRLHLHFHMRSMTSHIFFHMFVYLLRWGERKVLMSAGDWSARQAVGIDFIPTQTAVFPGSSLVLLFKEFDGRDRIFAAQKALCFCSLLLPCQQNPAAAAAWGFMPRERVEGYEAHARLPLPHVHVVSRCVLLSARVNVCWQKREHRHTCERGSERSEFERQKEQGEEEGRIRESLSVRRETSGKLLLLFSCCRMCACMCLEWTTSRSKNKKVKGNTPTPKKEEEKQIPPVHRLPSQVTHTFLLLTFTFAPVICLLQQQWGVTHVSLFYACHFFGEDEIGLRRISSNRYAKVSHRKIRG